MKITMLIMSSARTMGFLLITVAFISCSYGCSTALSPSGSHTSTPGPPSESIINHGGEIPTALINGRSINENEFRTLTAETSGRLILNEMAIDRALQQRLDEAGLSVGEANIQRERQALLQSLDPDPEQAVRLLRALRTRRSLGPARFDNLLRRNAGLRLLVRDSITISEERLHDEFMRWYGPRYRIRLMTLDSQNRANELLRKLRAGAPFNELAARESTDISAERGGLLAPISVKDTSYPSTIRQVIGDLLPGEISPVIPIDNQFAIVQVVERIPAQQVNFASVRNNLLQTVRRNEERRLMDVLARELLAQTEVVILDPSIKNGNSF